MSATSWLYAELTVWRVGRVTSWLPAVEKPPLKPWSDVHQNLCSGWCSWRNHVIHVCQVSKWNFPGLRFYRGSNFPFLANVNYVTFAICYRRSVCLSPVCLSICLWRWCAYSYSAGWNFRQFFSPYDSPGTLVFWYQNSLVRSKWPTPFQTVQFRSISAHSASTVKASEKCSISIYRKSTTRCPTSHRWTVYVTPKSPKGGTKTRYRCLCQ